MTRSFVEKLEHAMAAHESLLCVGLDPDPARLPADLAPTAPVHERVRRFCQGIIEQTADVVCCYKPNYAFFEQLGPEGLAVLRDVIRMVPPELPVLLDAKRGDVGHTAEAYARAAFEVWGADAVTVNPYLGLDGVRPFLAHAGKAVFLLCHTSNPSAADIQHWGAPPLYQHVARLGMMWGEADQVGYVVGATQPEALRQVREIAPDRWILAPGVGAQGGNLEGAVRAGTDPVGGGLIVPVSRAVLYAEDPRGAALALRDAINRARPGFGERRQLILKLFEAGCVRFGSFTLASGMTSPVYVDLRRVISYPELFEAVVEAYADVIRTLTYERLAAVPYAALPAAAATALRLAQPLVYPRKEVKKHGTGRMVEGDFEPGQVAVAIEDVVTTGGSLLTAIETMEAAGLEVHDVVVLVDREQGGREALAAAGYRLHAILTLSQILSVLHEAGRIDQETLDRVLVYLHTERA